ncbi:hypothetical protein HDU85_002191 [Gaertneriomyces sp. JEL0708]|nr:hypothetical protein HDU85_002191 [Gaertneriomyces sp. JEL0708]
MSPRFTWIAAMALALAGTALADPNNVIKNNELYYIDGKVIFYLPRVRDLMLRTAALTVLIVDVIVWALAFRNKHSLVSRLICLFILAHMLGLLCNLLPKIGAAPNSPALTIGVGVGGYLISSETFTWVLYLRFSMVIPFQQKLRLVTLTWLIVESLLVLANWIFWVVEAHTEGGATDRAMRMYFYVSIAQTLTAFGLSGYFVVTYYKSHLLLQRKALTVTSTRSTPGLLAHFFTTGLLYLFLESLLHCSYIITSNTVLEYRTGVTSLLTGVRYGLFLLFVLAMREDGSNHSNPQSRNKSRGQKLGSFGDVESDQSRALSESTRPSRRMGPAPMGQNTSISKMSGLDVTSIAPIKPLDLTDVERSYNP